MTSICMVVQPEPGSRYVLRGYSAGKGVSSGILHPGFRGLRHEHRTGNDDPRTTPSSCCTANIPLLTGARAWKGPASQHRWRREHLDDQ